MSSFSRWSMSSSPASQDIRMTSLLVRLFLQGQYFFHAHSKIPQLYRQFWWWPQTAKWNKWVSDYGWSWFESQWKERLQPGKHQQVPNWCKLSNAEQSESCPLSNALRHDEYRMLSWLSWLNCMRRAYAVGSTKTIARFAFKVGSCEVSFLPVFHADLFFFS